MEINDNVYGYENVKDGVLIDLIQSKAIQRLKGISQQGIPRKYSFQPNFSRYVHSIGVFILLKRLGADLKEQIAGLIHDVSHPAFSHLIDWVNGDPIKQSHQDENYIIVLKNSDIPIILNNYGFDANEFFDLSKFTLLEREIPNLCADRIDYCLRDIVAYGGKVICDKILQNIAVYEGKIIFNSPQEAYAFAQEFISLWRYSWSDDRHVASYYIFANILRKGLHEKVIQESDFYKEESNIINKLEASNHTEIKEGLNLLRNGFWLDYKGNSVLLKSKFRYVDPDVLINGSLKKLSNIFNTYKYQIELQRDYYNKPRYVGINPR